MVQAKNKFEDKYNFIRRIRKKYQTLQKNSPRPQARQQLQNMDRPSNDSPDHSQEHNLYSLPQIATVKLRQPQNYQQELNDYLAFLNQHSVDINKIIIKQKISSITPKQFLKLYNQKRKVIYNYKIPTYIQMLNKKVQANVYDMNKYTIS